MIWPRQCRRESLFLSELVRVFLLIEKSCCSKEVGIYLLMNQLFLP